MQTINKSKLREILSTRFLNDEITSIKDLPSPFLLKDMDKASQRIKDAILNKEKIVIVSDYDVDGVVSRVILEIFFDFLSKDFDIDYECVTPNRFNDGYGLSSKIIKDKNAKVVITVDNGITSYEAGEFCAKNNIDLIITDHHIASKLPKAFAIINPKQNDCEFPFSNICGAQIAWYFTAGIKKALNVHYDLNDTLDILVFAIIADVMPLVSLNRVLVKKCLKTLNTSQRPSILALKKYLRVDKFKAQDIAFNIAPKINSAGRLEDAIFAVEFLKAKDIEEGLIAYEYLYDLNAQRQSLQKEMFEIASTHNIKNEPIIISIDKSFNAGVVGIVASKLVDEYKKIAFVGSVDEDMGIVKMSVRSFGDVDIYKLISMCKKDLINFGGHKQAAGLSLYLKDLDTFKKQLLKAFDKHFEFQETSNILGILDINDIDKELIDLIDEFEPYGEQNEQPIFLIKNVEILKMDKIGKNKDTLKLELKTKQGMLYGIKFNFMQEIEDIKEVDIVATVNENIFNNTSSIQCIIRDIIYK